MSAIGTMIGVGTLVALFGISLSASGAVSSTFNAQLATQVSFEQASNASGPNLITIAAQTRVAKLRGVVHAGEISEIDGFNPLPFSRTLNPQNQDQTTAELPVMMATPSALTTMHASVASGRLFDEGMVQRGENVALLSSVAAEQLGIRRVDTQPSIFIGPLALTVIGIIKNVDQQSQVLSGIVVPPNVAALISVGSSSPQLIVQTRQGAAGVVGAEGPLAVSPTDPQAITAIVPPSPTLLRQAIEGSISDLLFALAAIALLIGIVMIANTTLLSVIQRQSEIGLRRVFGATPAHIALLILTETAFVGAVGGILGASIGILATGIMSLVQGWTPVIDWQITIAAPFLGILAGILAGIYPSYRSTRITPLKALRRS
jgi:putative ABC transport system permease protein